MILYDIDPKMEHLYITEFQLADHHMHNIRNYMSDKLFYMNYILIAKSFSCCIV